MGKLSREKGKRGEREFASLCREYGYAARRGQQYSGAGGEDVVGLPELPAAVLYDLWPHGRPHPTPLDGSGNYRRLAEYLVKETAAAFREGDAPYKKRWNQSKNLKEPTIRVEVVNARTWSREPRPRKGYALDKDSLRQGVHEITGYPYQYYTLVRLRPEKERPEQERRGR